MRGKQSGSGTMEEPCRAFDTKPSTTALESEPVSETDVSHGKHRTDPIQGRQGKSSKADSMDQDLLVCVVSERSKLKKMTQWNRQPKETRNQESNRT